MGGARKVSEKKKIKTGYVAVYEEEEKNVEMVCHPLMIKGHTVINSRSITNGRENIRLILKKVIEKKIVPLIINLRSLTK